MTDDALWTSGLGAARRARLGGAVPLRVGGVSIDTRSARARRSVRRDQGRDTRRPRFRRAQPSSAGRRRRSSVAHAAGLSGARLLYIVTDTQQRSKSLARRGAGARRRLVVAVTGRVGKTTTKEMLRAVCAHVGPTHASAASYNNQWGVPLSLARMPRGDALRRLRDRHEPCRRDRRRSSHWSGPMWRSSPRSRRRISKFSRSRRSPTRRPRFSAACCQAASPILNRDDELFAARRARRARLAPAFSPSATRRGARRDSSRYRRRTAMGDVDGRDSRSQLAVSYRRAGRAYRRERLAVLLVARSSESISMRPPPAGGLSALQGPRPAQKKSPSKRARSP